MQNLLLLFILSFVLNFQLMKSHACKFATKNVDLVFHQFLESSSNPIIQMQTSPVIYSKYQAGNIYVLNGNRTTINTNTLRIFNIRCVNINDYHDGCTRYFHGR